MFGDLLSGTDPHPVVLHGMVEKADQSGDPTGPADQPVVDGEQGEATLLTCGPESPADLHDGGDRLLLLIVASASGSAAWPDHLASPVSIFCKAYLLDF